MVKEVEEISDVSIDDLLENKLIVWNDDVNTFEWVIECLIKYAKHSPEQAEQCAYLIHYKGKCMVRNGSMEELLPIKVALTDAGISAEIQ